MDKAFLYLHIFCGFTALAIGIIPMVAEKGKKLHNISGLIYFWAMTGVFISTVLLLFSNATLSRIFLAFVAIFSFYHTLTGYLSLRHKKHEAGIFEKVVIFTLLISSTMALAFGTVMYTKNGLSPFPVLCAIFGVFGIITARKDYQLFLKPNTEKEKMHWWFNHMQRMLTSYIATFTAFCVVNARTETFISSMLVWVLPGVIGGIGIGRWVKYYREKFNVPVKK